VKEATRALLKKARRALEAAQRDLEAGDADNAVARAYYAAFHAVTAAPHEAGRRGKSHPGTQQLFYEHFVRTGRLDRAQSSLFSSLFQMRQAADYAFGTVFSADRAQEAVRDAGELVDVIEALIERP
jgi:uncharacterized protein (UPF0332 family)